jgi:adenylylsulfate kinase-like enzyme
MMYEFGKTFHKEVTTGIRKRDRDRLPRMDAKMTLWKPMTSDPIPLLWLCGPSGAGKSTVGWQFFSDLTQSGIRVGYLDIDQLGMCYPAPGSDPDRHHIKARNLGAMVANFEAAGADCVLVSGVVEEIYGVRNYVDQISQTALTLCRLRVDRDILTERLVSRGWAPHQVDAALRESDELDHSDFSDVCIDTNGLAVSEVIQQLCEKTGNWPALPRQNNPFNFQRPTVLSPQLPNTPGAILWLCGTTGVGKSTVGWKIFQEVQRAGIRAAFVDLEQIGFCRPIPDDDPGNHRIKSDNLAGLWKTFHASGARCLIVVGPVNHSEAVQIYRDKLPEATLTLCRLHAGAEQLGHRIMLRGQGHGPGIAGDCLKGKTAEDLEQISEKASETAEVLQHATIGDLCIDTDDLTIEDVARMVLDQANGWPGSV